MEVGRRLGAYQIERELGRGGMGAVYVGKHTLLGRPAAIKVLQPRFTTDPEVVNRFFNEAKAATAIRHAGIVEVFDFGYSDDGAAFIVMELCDGESLAARLERRGSEPLDLATALGYARQIAAALAAAHKAGIVHRDLKPDNVFLVPDEEVIGGKRVKLLDFGIAKLVGDAGAPMVTSTGAIMGTPLYMSPEQCRGAGKVDHRADLYSLGCILFEMLCGRVPFVGEGPGEVLGAHLLTPPPAPRSMNPGIPVEVEAFVLSLLAKKADERPPTADACVEQLRRLAGTPVTAPLAAASSGNLVAPVPATLPPSMAPAPRIAVGSANVVEPARTVPIATEAPRKRSKAPLIAIGAIVVAGGGIATAVVLSGGGGATAAAPDAAVKVVAADAPDAAVKVAQPESPPDAAVSAPAVPDAAPKRPGVTADAVLTKLNAAYLHGIQLCFRDALADKPKGGRVALSLTIRPNGRVEKGRARGFDDGVDRCITGKMSGWVFPASEATDSVTLEVSLQLLPDREQVAETKPETRPEAKKPDCDSAKLAELKSTVEAAIARGNFGEAIATADKVLACGFDGSIVARAFLAACNGRDATNARRFYKQMDAGAQGRYKQICTRNGITLDAPSAAKDTEPSFDDLLKEAGVAKKTSLSAADFKTGISRVTGAVKACYAGTQGAANLRVTISAAGDVVGSIVTGVFADTPVGKCVMDAVLQAKFPPWDGPPQAFSYTFLLAE